MSSWHNIYLFIYHMILVSAIVFCKSIFNCIDSSYSFYDEYNSIRLHQELYAILCLSCIHLFYLELQKKGQALNTWITFESDSCKTVNDMIILTSLVWSPNTNLYVSKVKKNRDQECDLWCLYNAAPAGHPQSRP